MTLSCRLSYFCRRMLAAALLPLLPTTQAIGSNVGDYYNDLIGTHGDEGNPQGATRLEPVASHYSDYYSIPTYYDKVILGNASYGNGSADGIISIIWQYHEYMSTYGYQDYIHNVNYTYPALTRTYLGYDNSHCPTSIGGLNNFYHDLYVTMTPTVGASDGASGSEVEIVNLAFAALNAMDPVAKAKMKANGLIMPTLQMLWRRTRSWVHTDADYLTGLAHPTSFSYVTDGFFANGLGGAHYNQEGARYAEMASAIRADNIPPMVQLSVIQDGFAATNGQDYFEFSSYGEKLPDSPVSISRLFRGRQHTQSITVSAEGSYDINNRPLTYQWVVLRGDPSLVHITPLNNNQSRVQIDFDYNPTRPYTNLTALGTLWCEGGGAFMVNSSMAMVGAFVNNGAYFSAPGYITSYSMPDEVRAYDTTGRLMKITYTANRGLCDIEQITKGWSSDTFRYDSDGALQGWTRSKSGVLTDFTKEGYLVVTKDAGRAPLTVSQVTYSDGGYLNMIWTTNGLPFAYANKPVYFQSDQLAIVQGARATLAWSITGGSSVSIDQGIGAVAAAGTNAVFPSATTTYTLTATVGGNVQTAAVTVAVLPPLTVSLTANPTVLTVGQSAVLSWSAANATNVSISPNVGTVENIGMRSVCQYDTTTYTLSAMGTGGTLTTNVTVYVVGKPNTSFSAAPASITNGGTSVLTWNTAGAFTVMTNNAAAALSGSASVSLSNTTTYTLIATGPNGVTIIPVKVYVGTPAPPSAQFSASAPAILAGQSSTLSWNTADATNITINQGIGAVAASGTMAVSPITTTTYNLVAIGAASPVATNTVTITVFPTNTPAPTASITAAAQVISVGQFTLLTWLTTNASSAILDNGIGNVPASGTLLIMPTNTTTYTLTASNPNGTVSTTITVTLRDPPAISAFSSAPSTVDSGNPATLTWSTAGADSVSIIPGIGFVPSSGSTTVMPVSTTTYTLTAVGAGGVSTKIVTVNAAPAITFNATPPMLNGLSSSSALIWTTIGATGARIDQGLGTVAAAGGTTNVSPMVNTTYTLTATNTHGAATAQVTVYAQGSPSINMQPASAIVTQGMTATFTAAATGTAPLQYQWLLNGTNIDGAINASYTTPATTLSDDGSVFSIVVSNAIGSVTGNGALLTVIGSAPHFTIAGMGNPIANGDSTPGVADGTDFGNLNIAAAAITNTFTIANLGAAMLYLTGDTPIALTGDPAFTLNTVGLTTNIAGRTSTRFGIVFAPTTTGPKTAVVTIANNDTDNAPFIFSIQGAGSVTPIMTVSSNGTTISNGDATPSVAKGTDFASVPVLLGAVTNIFAVTNSGNGTLLLNNATPIVIAGNSADFSVNTSSMSTNIAVGASTTFAIIFDPTAGGLRTGVVSIANNDSIRNPYTFNIQGTGIVNPIMAVSGNGINIPNGDATPGSADGTDFGSLDIAFGSVTNTFAITNSGNGTLYLTSATPIGLTGDTADFTVNTAGMTTNIAVGAYTTFKVIFDPAVAGTKTGVVSIANNDTNTPPYTFRIQGVGILQPVIAISFNGTTIANGDTTPSGVKGTDFGSLDIAQVAATNTFTITNSGPATLYLTGATPIGIAGNTADFTVNTAGLTTNIAAGASTTFVIIFDPTSVGTRTGMMSIANNDINMTPYTFSITGLGVAGQEAVMAIYGNGLSITNGDTTPNVLDGTDFGIADIVYGAVTNTYTIANYGNTVLYLTNTTPISLTGDTSEFAMNTIGMTTNIAVGSFTTFRIVFDPNTVGVKNCVVSIANNDADSTPYRFSIQGTAKLMPYVSWNNSAKILFAGYTAAETLTNYPALVALSTNNIGGFSYAQFLSGSNDLRFADATKTTPLNFEIDTWNTNGASYIWVQVPALVDNTTAIYAFWGKTNQSQSASQTNGATWNSNYLAVWHLNEIGTGAVGDYRDSTTNHINSINSAITNEPTAVTGIIGGGQSIVATSSASRVTNITFGTSSVLNKGLTNNYTVSLWVKPAATNQQYYYITRNLGAWYAFGQYTGNQLFFRDKSAATFTAGLCPSSTTAFHQVALVGTDASHVRFCTDGITTTNLYAGTNLYSAVAFTIGTPSGSGVMNGSVDEVRVSKWTSSSNWLWADYMTITSNALFQTYGAATGVITQRQITAVSVGHGTLAPSGTVLIAVNSSRAFTNTPDLYYQTALVMVDGSAAGTNNVYTFTNVVADHTITVTFTPVVAAMGTPEWWLAQYGMTNDFNAAEQADPFHSGMANQLKYLMGMDPLNPEAAFKIVSIEALPASNGVWWYGGTTNTGFINLFAVEALTNLGSSQWAAKGSNLVTGTSGTNVWWDTNLPPTAPEFYRITTHVSGP